MELLDLKRVGLRALVPVLLVCQMEAYQRPSAQSPATMNPLGLTPQAIDSGRNTFHQVCTSCHGPNGEGGQGEGQGPNLVNSWEVRRASDADLFGFVHNGVPGTAMPAFPLPSKTIWELVAFVRSLNSPAANVPVTGNAQSGEAIFFGKGHCGDCHKIRGRGGYLGPDLTDAGMISRVEQLRQAILAKVRPPVDGYRAVVLTTADGSRLRGIVKQQSSWSIDVLDESGHLHLLRGAGMKDVSFRSESWMPVDYSQRLSPQDTQDLVAFLSRQTLRQPNQESVNSPDRKRTPQ